MKCVICGKEVEREGIKCLNKILCSENCVKTLGKRGGFEPDVFLIRDKAMSLIENMARMNLDMSDENSLNQAAFELAGLVLSFLDENLGMDHLLKAKARAFEEMRQTWWMENQKRVEFMKRARQSTDSLLPLEETG